jgi:hypothetical protein
VSVGHVARIFESAGISTVTVGVRAYKSRMVPMNIPRLVLTPELMGKTFGRPNDSDTQTKYLQIALDLLENATEGGAVVEIEK